jgi:hypothetical protein
MYSLSPHLPQFNREQGGPPPSLVSLGYNNMLRPSFGISSPTDAEKIRISGFIYQVFSHVGLLGIQICKEFYRPIKQEKCSID